MTTVVTHVVCYSSSVRGALSTLLSHSFCRSATGTLATSARGTPCASWPAMSSQSCCRLKGGEAEACTCIGRPTAARRRSDPGTPSGGWAVAWQPPCPGTRTTLTGASPAQPHRGLLHPERKVYSDSQIRTSHKNVQKSVSTGPASGDT